MIAILLIVLLLAYGASRYALQRYEAALAEGSRMRAPLSFTGGEMALEFLKDRGITDVQLVEHEGLITDYFDPARRRLFLRRHFKDGQHLAAWAVALHEAGHALQTGESLAEFNWRRSCIKITRYLPTLSVIIATLPLLIAVAATWALIMAMNIGTLAIERNANLHLRRFIDDRLGAYPSAQEKIDQLLKAVSIREVGDLIRSPRLFFFSALPGKRSTRPGR
jgi:Zn-dependent membrane protease YugP